MTHVSTTENTAPAAPVSIPDNKASTTSASSSASAAVPANPSLAPAHTLRIGGITPLTTIDFPGRLAAVLYCQGCPWRCSYCHNPALLDTQAPAALSWAQAWTFLQSR